AMFVCHWNVSSDQLFVSPVATIPTPSEIGALQPGDNVSELTNDSGFVDAAGAAAAAPVQSVNSQTGSVVLDADDIDDTATVNKFVTTAEKSDIASAVQPGDLATVATTGAYSDLSGTPTLGTAAAADIGDFATSAQG